MAAAACRTYAPMSCRFSRVGTLRAVNTRGGLARDRLAILNRLGAFLPVGFYYKAFHSKRWFPRWERMFRNLTGLGKVDLRSSAHAARPSATISAMCW